MGQEFNIRNTLDGVEGLNAIRIKPPDIVLLNLKMPRASGFWVLEQLKVHQIVVPVVIVSYYEYDYVLEKTAGYKIDGFVLDNITVEKVRNVVMKILG